MKGIKTVNLFDLDFSIAGEYLIKFDYPWSALKELKKYIYAKINALDSESYVMYADGVRIHKSAKVDKSAVILPPCIICENAEIRPSAYIRGSVIVGKGCVVGNSSEVKNSVLFDEAKIPHYNYVGDSILGHCAHLGAGAITSNVKSDKTVVNIKKPPVCIATGLKKVGSFIGDNVEIGCGTVLCPGTVIGKNTTVYPLSLVRGVVDSDSIYKKEGNIVKRVY